MLLHLALATPVLPQTCMLDIHDFLLVTVRHIPPAAPDTYMLLHLTLPSPVLSQPSILDLHDLPPDLPQDLLPPSVSLVQICALCRQVWPPCLWPSLLILLCR